MSTSALAEAIIGTVTLRRKAANVRAPEAEPRRVVRRDGSIVFKIRWLTDGRSGTYRQETLEGVSLREARALLRLHRADAKEHRKKRLGRGTLGELLDLYLRHYLSDPTRISASWRTTAETMLRLHILPALGSLPLGKLRALTVDEYQKARRDEGAAGGTINAEVSIISGGLAWAVRKGVIGASPLPKGSVDRQKPRKAGNPFSPEEWQKLVHAFEDEAAWTRYARIVRQLAPVTPKPDRAPPSPEALEAHRARLASAVPVFQALLVTGCRVSELLYLRWQDVDREAGIVTFRQGKAKTTDEPRSKKLPLVGPLRDLILSRPAGVAEAFVFQKPSGGRWDIRRLRVVFYRAQKLARLSPRRRLHDIRHSASTWTARAGATPSQQQGLLGHASARTTLDVYTHLQPNDLGAVLEMLGRLALVEPLPVQKAPDATGR